MTPDPGQDLFQDALVMSVNKNLADVATLLEWAAKGTTPSEKLRHIRKAMELLADVEQQLQDMDHPPVVF